MIAYIYWDHFTKEHKARKVGDRTQVWVEANGGKWRWYTVQRDQDRRDFIRCEFTKIYLHLVEEEV